MTERLRAKMSLIRRLLSRGYGRKDIIHLFRFIDWLLVLPPELEEETRRQVAELEGGTPMPYVTSFERLGDREGGTPGRSARGHRSRARAPVRQGGAPGPAAGS